MLLLPRFFSKGQGWFAGPEVFLISVLILGTICSLQWGSRYDFWASGDTCFFRVTIHSHMEQADYDNILDIKLQQKLMSECQSQFKSHYKFSFSVGGKKKKLPIKT